jgi:hypothetical protein
MSVLEGSQSGAKAAILTLEMIRVQVAKKKYAACVRNDSVIIRTSAARGGHQPLAPQPNSPSQKRVLCAKLLLGRRRLVRVLLHAFLHARLVLCP